MKKVFAVTIMLLAYGVSQAQRVFSVDYENQADVKVYFVKYENQAGWENTSKQALME